ncbi:MAG: iron chaperone [Candidatus Dormibacteria bacterium]
MSEKEIDDYLAGVEEPKRRTLQQLRETIMAILPDAEPCISYRVPAFRQHGQVVAGFAAFKNHLAYLPFSGSVLGELKPELAGYSGTKSSLHFPVDQPLPRALVESLIAVRLRQILERAHA